MSDFASRGRDHARSHSSASSHADTYKAPERTPAEKANDAVVSASRAVTTIDHDLEAVRKANAANDPRAWHEAKERLAGSLTRANADLERARTHANAASEQSKQQLAEAERTLADHRATAASFTEAPRGWNDVSRETGILAILEAPVEGSAHAGFAQKEKALKAEFAQLSAAESNLLITRLRKKDPADRIAQTFARLTGERRDRLIEFLQGARRREALNQARNPSATKQQVSGTSAQLSAPATSSNVADTTATPAHDGSKPSGESPLSWPDSIIVERKVPTPAAGNVDTTASPKVGTEQHAIRTAPSSESPRKHESRPYEGGFLGAIRGVAQTAHASKAVPEETSAVTPAKIEAYLFHNHVEVWRTIGDHLNAATLPEPHERLRWMNSALFHSAILNELAAKIGDFKKLQKLDEVLFPATAAKVIGASLPSTAEWSVAVGMAIAHALQIAIIGSTHRIANRYLEVADARRGEEAVRFEQLVLSMPIDRYVGKSICRRGVVTVEPVDAKAATEATAKPAGLRPITKITFEGERDPKLWNWVRIEPADATPEEVAAELWKVTDGHGEANASFNAYVLAAAPPLFGVPKRMAIHMKPFSNLAAKAFRGNAAAVIGGDTIDAQLLQIANSSIVDDVAHEPLDGVANAKRQGAPATLEAVQEQLRDCDLQLAFIKEKLSRWGLGGHVAGAVAFVKRQQTDMPLADAKKLGDVAMVIAGQKDRLAQIASAINNVESASRQLGASDTKSDEAAPLREILELLGVAAGTSHIASASEPKLVEAMHLQATLSVRALQSSERNMMGSVSYVHQQAGDNRTTGNLSHEAVDLQQQSRELQSKLLDGQHVDPERLEDVSIESEQVALNGRLYGSLDALKDMQDAARGAGAGDAAIIASLAGDKFPVLGPAFLSSNGFGALFALTDRIADEIHPIVGNLKSQWKAINGELKLGVGSPTRKAELREARRKTLADAQAQFSKIAEDRDLQHFFKKAAEKIKSQQLRTAIVRAAAFVGISIVAGAVAEFAAAGMAGMLMDATGAVEVAELGMTARATIGATRAVVDTTINAAAQTALTGQSFSEAWQQNMIMFLASSAVFGSMARYAQQEAQQARAEEELMRVWGAQRQVGKLAKAGQKLGALGEIAKDVGVISVHTLWGAAMNEVAARLTTGKAHPSASTMEEWAIQGASVALGRHLSSRIAANQKLHKEIDAALGNTKHGLAAKAANLQELAAKAATSKDDGAILKLLEANESFMRDKLAAIELAIAKTGDPTGELALNQQATELELQNAGSVRMLDVKFSLNGLEELVPGALWKGTRENVDRAIAQANTDGHEVKVLWHDEHTGLRKVLIDERVIEIHEIEKAPGVKPQAAHDKQSPQQETETKSTAEKTQSAAAQKQSQVILAGDDARLREAAANIKPVDGWLDVITHGTVDDFEVLIGGNIVTIDHRALAQWVGKSGAPYKRIRLLSCETGKHAKGAAQHLANKLGVEVMAPTDYLHVFPDGQMVIGPTDQRNTGTWKVFKPTKSSRRFSQPKERGPERAIDRLHRKRAEGTGGETLHLGDEATKRPAVDGQTDLHDAAIAGHDFADKVSNRVGGSLEPTVKNIAAKSVSSDVQVEAGLRVLDNAFGETTSAELKRVAREIAKEPEGASKAADSESLESVIEVRDVVQKSMLDVLRDPSLNIGARKAALHQLLGQFDNAVQSFPKVDRNKIGFAKARDVIDSLSAEVFEGMIAVDAHGNLTQKGQRIGTLREMMDQVRETNAAYQQNGIDEELVISISTPRDPSIPREVKILSRKPRQLGDGPGQRKAQRHSPIDPTNPSDEGLVVDIGVGLGDFAREVGGEQGRVVKTEYGPSYADPAMMRRDLTWEHTAPHVDADSVVVVGDALQTLPMLFADRSVKRMFINNINAHYAEGNYQELARGLRQVMKAGGRVEVQWTTATETTGGVTKARGHITGEGLKEALSATAADLPRTISINENAAPVTDYEYSVEATRSKSGKPSKTPPSNPVPEKRWIFTFGN